MIEKVEKGLLINLFKKYLLSVLEEILILWERLVNIIIIESEQCLNRGTLESAKETTSPRKTMLQREHLSQVLKDE